MIQVIDELCLTNEVRWSPVKDELPEYEIPVLFWISQKTVDNNSGCYVGWYSNKEYDGQRGRWFDIYGRPVYQGVTHWMPFPSGPDCCLSVGLKIQKDF